MKKIIAIWLPFISGLLLVAVVAVDMHQFELGTIDVHDMLRRELPIVLFGMLSSLVVFVSSFYWLFKKQWFKAIQSLLSPFLFFVCFGIGGVMGASYLYAT